MMTDQGLLLENALETSPHLDVAERFSKDGLSKKAVFVLVLKVDLLEKTLKIFVEGFGSDPRC